MNVILGRSSAGEGRKDNAMRNGQSADLEGGEESRRIREGRHVSRVRCE